LNIGYPKRSTQGVPKTGDGNESFLAPTGNSGCQNRRLDAASSGKSEVKNRSTSLKLVGKWLLMVSGGSHNSMSPWKHPPKKIQKKYHIFIS